MANKEQDTDFPFSGLNPVKLRRKDQDPENASEQGKTPYTKKSGPATTIGARFSPHRDVSSILEDAQHDTPGGAKLPKSAR
jgi:hypothetical protein